MNQDMSILSLVLHASWPVLIVMILLLVVFRSILVPVKAVIMNLLSIAAAYGVLVAVFQWGWLGSVFGIHDPGPVMSFVPTIIIGVVFGLAMDYQLFLVSGMHEARSHGQDSRTAVRTGFVHGAKVVTAAAIIMTSVFLGFAFSHLVMIRPIGFALAFGVLVGGIGVLERGQHREQQILVHGVGRNLQHDVRDGDLLVGVARGGVDHVQQQVGLGHRGAVCFAQHRDHLLFCESTLSHRLLWGWEPSS